MKFSRIFFSMWVCLTHFTPSILIGASKDTSVQQSISNVTSVESIEFFTCGDPSRQRQSSSKNCATEIEKLIKTATIEARKEQKVEVDIFVYSINDWILVCTPHTNKGLLKDLLSNRNVRVRIVTDYEQFNQSKGYSRKTLECLKDNGAFPSNFTLKLWGYSKQSGQHTEHYQMHTKTAIFKIGDKKHLVMGSFNWTNGARNRNLENCIKIKGIPGQHSIIDKAETQFNSIWENSSDIDQPTVSPLQTNPQLQRSLFSGQPSSSSLALTSDSATSTIDSQMSGRGDNPLTESTTPIPTRQRRGVEQRSPPGGPPHPRLQGQQLTSRTTALANFPPQGNSADPSSSHSITRSRSSSPPASSPWSDITSSQQDIINKLP